MTVQGYANDSTWTRGQAWGIYGFAKSRSYLYSHPYLCLTIAVYFHTQEPRYLDTARRLANYFIDHIPDDGIVPW